MPFRDTFDCLWCGTPHSTRDPQDLEGWTQLCPACLAKAGANPFLRTRLKAGLAERAVAAGGGGGPIIDGPPPDPGVPAAQPASATSSLRGAPASPPAPSAPPLSPFGPTAGADLQDDFYLRRGAFTRGPVHDTAWQAELDAAGRWLDALPIRGEIVELAAGAGWWGTLLAAKGTLSLLDESPVRLERARDRLVAHRLRAHLHPRDRWAAPDRAADVLVVGPAIADVPAPRLAAFAAVLHAWLRPGGLLAAMDLLPDAFLDAGGVAFGRAHEPAALPAALAAAGFTAIQTGATGRSFALVRATA